MTRRSFIKWTTALGVAGAALVGIGAGYGSDLILRPSTVRTTTETTTKQGTTITNTATVTQPAQTVTATTTRTVTAPPATLSYVPPLSPPVQASVDATVKQLQSLHTGESVIYTNCSANGCAIGAGGPCLLAVHVKNGVMTTIDVGDNLNVNNPRESVSDTALTQEMVQVRPCVRGRAWRRTIYSPNRLLYPMKRVGQRGERKFVRIAWQEALDTTVQQLQNTYAKRGPLSMIGSFTPMTYVGNYGFSGWANSSYSGHHTADLVTVGANHATSTPASDFFSSEIKDLFNVKLWIGFGTNPAVTQYGMSYYIALAHEHGTKIVIVDPVLSMSAQTYADQWIPIRPNTDATMLLAIADVLFKEDLYDHTYVSNYVEPVGFQKWKDYVTGVEDGIEKTPEWAAPICGVPAATIRSLAELYGKTKPAYLRAYWVSARQHYGENVSRMGAYLQAMTGNIGISGGGYSIGDAGAGAAATSAPSVPFTRGTAPYPNQRVMHVRGWMDAMLNKAKLDAGQMTTDEYKGTIGGAKDWPMPNVGFIWGYVASSGVAKACLGNHDLNKQIQCMKMADFTVVPIYSDITFPGAFYADIILPMADNHFEDYMGFGLGSGLTNYFLAGFKCVQPAGEAKSAEWINVQIAKRFGVDKQYNAELSPVADDPVGWDTAYEAVMQKGYEAWAAGSAVKPLNPPAWADFKKIAIWRVQHTKAPYVTFWDKMLPPIGQGNPFDTVSGKIEFYSSFLADPNMAQKSFVKPQSKLDVKVCFGGSIPPKITPVAKWIPPPNSFVDPLVSKYPLMMISSHSYYRQHVSQDNNLWLRQEARHACWLSVADAKARGINDGDIVWVHNDKGEVALPAYVTSRITPGIVVIRHGAWAEPSGIKTALSPDGLDMRGAENFLTWSTDYPWIIGPTHTSTLVDVGKMPYAPVPGS